MKLNFASYGGVYCDFMPEQHWLSSPAYKNLSMFKCRFVIASYNDSLFEQFGISPEISLDRAVLKRRAEFLAGRYCAHRAMTELGISGWQVGIGRHRQPQWPDGIIGSITHTDDSAVCAVAKRRTEESVIGIDQEKWIEEVRAQELYRQIISTDELALMESIDGPFHELLTIVFSAKESLFKAYYGKVGEYFDFKEASLLGIEHDGLSGRTLFQLSDWLGSQTGLKQPVCLDHVASDTGVMTFHSRDID